MRSGYMEEERGHYNKCELYCNCADFSNYVLHRSKHSAESISGLVVDETKARSYAFSNSVVVQLFSQRGPLIMPTRHQSAGQCHSRS